MLGFFVAYALWAYALSAGPALAQTPPSANAHGYFGFDKDEYPGDDLLGGLHRSFAYTGYWLNNPPGESHNPWKGKRARIRAQGFGFLILFNGRVDAELKGKDAVALGRADAATTVANARAEGFPAGAILFLDQEEGGRLLPEQAAYLSTWTEGVRHSPYKPGVYCSGIEVGAGADAISTAQDILHRLKGSAPALWVANDQCPPSPGCTLPRQPSSPSAGGVPQALVWQYALSPRRPQFTAQCRATYAADGQCYAPGLPHTASSFVDFNLSRSADPSRGR